MTSAQALSYDDFARLAGDAVPRFSVFKDRGDVVCLKGWGRRNEPLFIKFFRGRQGGRDANAEYQALSRYYERMRASKTCSIQKPLAFLKDDMLGGAILFEWTTARRADHYFKLFMPLGFLRRRGISQSADWLGMFHEVSGVSHMAVRECLDEGALSASLRALQAKVGGLDADGGDAIGELARLMERMAARPVVCSTMHSDFQPVNLFITRQQVIGFDFTAKATGPVLFDIGKFVTALIWYGSFDLRKSAGEKFMSDVEIFMEAYGRRVAPDAPEIRTIFLVKALADLATRLEADSHMGKPRRRLTKRRHLRAVMRVLTHVLNGGRTR